MQLLTSCACLMSILQCKVQACHLHTHVSPLRHVGIGCLSEAPPLEMKREQKSESSVQFMSDELIWVEALGFLRRSNLLLTAPLLYLTLF